MRDFAAETADAALAADVCVVGAGVAGQTVAERLARRGVDVLLVESGGRDFDPAIQDLAAGEIAAGSQPYYSLRDARLRVFGGTTAIWGGRCAPLDSIDFERRPWVPYSGWPFGPEALSGYTDEAFVMLGLKRPPTGLANSPLSRTGRVDLPIWVFDDEGERFTATQDALITAGVRLVLGATLTRIDVGETGAAERLTFSNLRGATLTVSARRVVIAAGGIETARILLACAPARPSGLGNGRDLVGRFFQEHPHARAGEAVPETSDRSGATRLLELFPKHVFAGGLRHAAAVRPSEAAQRELGLLNSAATVALRPRENGTLPLVRRAVDGLKHQLPAKRSNRRAYHAAKQAALRLAARRYPAPQARRYAKNPGQFGLAVVARAEQAPNPDSRVTLSEDRDALGVRRAVLDWRLSPIDKDSLRGLVACLDDALRQTGTGSAVPASWLAEPETVWRSDPLVSAHAIAGYHHMGTTRMAGAPSAGVVDPDGRLFDSPNVYVAGSSVFPTSGWANPTLTIIALALRLGDHLADQDRYHAAKRASPSSSGTAGS